MPMAGGRTGGAYAEKTYGKFKICDEKFYSYWNNGLIDKIFPDWF